MTSSSGPGRVSFESESTMKPEARMGKKREEGVEIAVEEVFYGVKVATQVLGFSIWDQKDGVYTIRYRRLLPTVFLCLTCFGVLCFETAYLLFAPVPYWYIVNNAPYIFSYGYIVSAYVWTLLCRESMAQYLTVMRSFRIMRCKWKSSLALYLYLWYCLVVVVCTLLMLPEFEVAVNIPLVCFISIAPAVLDLYITSFIVVIKVHLKKLSIEMRAKETWTAGDVRTVLDRWLEITRVLAMHNETFKKHACCRVLMLLLKILACLYILCSFHVWTGDCKTLLVITALPLWDSIAIFFNISIIGQQFAESSDQVLGAAMAATYQVPAGSQEQLALTSLVGRIESQPSRVLVWGMDSLTVKTFVHLSGMLLSYLIMVIQLGMEDKLARQFNETLTSYDHCFRKLANNST